MQERREVRKLQHSRLQVHSRLAFRCLLPQKGVQSLVLYPGSLDRDSAGSRPEGLGLAKPGGHHNLGIGDPHAAACDER